MDELKLRQEVEGLIKQLDETITLLITLQGRLKALCASTSGPDAKGERYFLLAYTFRMPNPDSLNHGPLRWLRKQLEDEASKGHIAFKRSFKGDDVIFEIELKPEASKDDRAKIERWVEWTKKALERKEVSKP